MTKTVEPNPSSILARLRNLGRNTYPNLPANTMLLLYAQQGLLARLEASSHSEHFVLKGALSLFARFGNAARPTEDIDLAARDLPNIVLPNTTVAISQILTEVCAVPFNDGLNFEVDAVSARVINERLAVPGVSLDLHANLGPSRVKLQIDVSFGNAITPEPLKLDFPTLLIPEAVRIAIYPLETVIAEKFAALVEIGEATTRMKDVFDLHTILSGQSFEAKLMHLAFERSFQARQTPESAVSVTLSEDFAHSPDLTRRWRQYLTRNRFVAPEFDEVMASIRAFCAPLLLEGQTEGRWLPGQGWRKN